MICFYTCKTDKMLKQLSEQWYDTFVISKIYITYPPPNVSANCGYVQIFFFRKQAPVVPRLFSPKMICLVHPNTLLVFIIAPLRFLKKLLLFSLFSCDHCPDADKITLAILCHAIQRKCIVPQVAFVPLEVCFCMEDQQQKGNTTKLQLDKMKWFKSKVEPRYGSIWSHQQKRQSFSYLSGFSIRWYFSMSTAAVRNTGKTGGLGK